MIDIDIPDEAQLKLAADGMKILVCVLGNVTARIGNERH
jgi:hypothetical protein